MSQRYAHLADGYLRAEVEKLNGLFVVGQSGKILVRRDEIDNLLKTPNLPTAFFFPLNLQPDKNLVDKESPEEYTRTIRTGS